MKQRFPTHHRFFLCAICSFCLCFANAQQKPQGAMAILEARSELSLTKSQISKIGEIRDKTLAKYRTASPGNRSSIRQEGQDQAIAELNPEQKAAWQALVSRKKTDRRSEPDDGSSRSLIIPSIDQLKNPPSRGAYGPTTSMVQTKAHKVTGRHYVILTDHTDTVALQALDQLAAHRNGEVINVPSLGTLYKDNQASASLRDQLKKKKVNYVAIAPTIDSYRENLHLFVLKLLTSLDNDPELDAFPGYLLASNPKSLASLIEKTINYTPLSPDDIKPVSIGAIEDDDARRYRSYQKAKVIQKMFADEGKQTPSVIITTRKKHTARSDFPDLEGQGDIVMLPETDRYTHQKFSSAALTSLNQNNILFMFGHGTTDRICGTTMDAFSEIDFADELVFCGSCMSATPYQADRLNLDSKRSHKRFAFHAMDNGAVMLLGHMGLCGGFPKVYPMAELVLEGKSSGEAYQRLMNSLIGRAEIPDYYPDNPPRNIQKKEPANNLLYVLWGDPALIAIKE